MIQVNLSIANYTILALNSHGFIKQQKGSADLGLLSNLPGAAL
jgi:hypothetical protein